MSEKNGGAAFPHVPVTRLGEEATEYAGMSLRDYFAAKAMVVVFPDCVAEGAVGSGEDWRVGIAMDCYAMADAMLSAREVKP